MMNVYLQRWNRARRMMEREGIGALVLFPSADLFYFTGYAGQATERVTCFVLTGEGATFVYPDFEQAKVPKAMLEQAACLGQSDTDDPIGAILQTIAHKEGAVAFGDRGWSTFLLQLQARLPGRAWVEGSRITIPLRMIKQESVIALHRKAHTLAQQALAALFKEGIGGKTERDVSDRLAALCREQGLAPAGQIVAAGENAASPHHENGDRILQKGDGVVIDFWGSYQGYFYDMTRTPVIEKAGPAFIQAYQVVLEANQAARNAVRPQASCESIDQAGRAVIEKAGYGPYFTHRLGHGLGLEEHEYPYMVQGNKMPLEKGMVFSDEPGIYIPHQLGIRIEDILCVTEDGCFSFTDFDRRLLEL